VSLPLALKGGVAAEAAGARVRRPSRRVLIIEDNVDAADSLREVLELGGHEVDVAYTGSEGLARARALRPQVVLCDLGLPGLDGFEVARSIRADEALKGVLLVALSGYAQQEDVQRAAEAGFERHLSKPPSIDQLEALLGHDVAG
jgi:CheY-like chemotaxis protein